MITGISLLSYCNVYTPKVFKKGEPKFSLACLIPKADKATIKDIEEGIQAAIAKGIEDGKFKQAHVDSPKFWIPLRDGDKAADLDERDESYRGNMFIDPRNTRAPGLAQLVEGRVETVIEEDVIYSGCFGRCDINFYAFNNESVGIGVGLNNVLKTADGERLDGRQNAESAFADFGADEGAME